MSEPSPSLGDLAGLFENPAINYPMKDPSARMMLMYLIDIEAIEVHSDVSRGLRIHANGMDYYLQARFLKILEEVQCVLEEQRLRADK